MKIDLETLKTILMVLQMYRSPNPKSEQKVMEIVEMIQNKLKEEKE